MTWGGDAEPVIDIVTVAHNERNWRQSIELEARIAEVEERGTYAFWRVDNQGESNVGFAAGCNRGAAAGKAPQILFLNPDAEVDGPFLVLLTNALVTPGVVIAGNRFGKPDAELAIWGCKRWVCGAVMGVTRDFFEAVGGFDERFVWGWEETDLVRQAESRGCGVLELSLPITHNSPSVDGATDAEYKRRHFEAGARAFRRKWQ